MLYSIVGLLVIMTGLASRRYADFVPSILEKYPGDALWTVLIFCLLGIARPKASPLKVFTLALSISFAVEFAQLIRWEWLVALRATRLGHLVLGSTFAVGDLVAYVVGALFALALELAHLKINKRQQIART